MIDEVAASVARDIAHDVLSWGARGVETGGFILACAHPGVGDVLALCGVAGITRRPDQLIISGEALAVLFEYAEARGCVVACQIHSHRFGPRLSPVDRRFGLTVEGFTSVVVPNWLTASSEPRDWGWWSFERGRWVAGQVPVCVAIEGRTLVFDEDGVVDA